MGDRSRETEDGRRETGDARPNDLRSRLGGEDGSRKSEDARPNDLRSRLGGEVGSRKMFKQINL